jgi:hypothetical protein
MVVGILVTVWSVVQHAQAKAHLAYSTRATLALALAAYT